jgi:hypothetical protein
MTAKEKAEEIRDNFYQLVADSSYPDELCKKCALILIDEILFICPLPNRDYYEEVKQEIHNL